MPTHTLYVVDLVAICVLVFGLFLPRHQRPELIVAFLTVNIGVLAVTSALSSSTVGAGLGLGLFGILSIIRLRSEELTQGEVAYYFAALALGLLGGLGGSGTWLEVALMVAVLAAVAVGDSPRVGRRASSQQLLLDRAHVVHSDLVAHLESLLGAAVVSAKVLRADLVNDTTLVEVRYRSDAVRRSTRDMPAQEMLG
jgi:hypothetical protein